MANPEAISQSDGAGGVASLTFHEFLDRMKQPAAADLVRRIRSFMVSFMGKDPEPEKDGESVQEFYRTTEAVFTTHPLWKGASPEELESSGEALEKYLMIKLFPKAFCPEPAEAERDQLLCSKIAALQHFLLPKHLDISHHLQNDASWLLAEKELQKMGSYKAPRDKLQCILNCCRIVNNLLLNEAISLAAAMPAHSAMGGGRKGDSGNGAEDPVKPPGADDFLPVLIYVLVKANPPQLLSNLLFIQRYRNASRLSGEASYFYTNLVSAASFIESLSAGQLSIDKDEYERLMEEGARKARDRPQAAGIVGATEPAQNEVQDRAASSPLGSSQTDQAQPRENRKEVLVTVEALQQRPGVVREIVRADASGELSQQFRFLYAQEGDIRLGDVPALLKGYKDLAMRYYALCRAVHGAQLVLDSARPRGEILPASGTDASVAGSENVQDQAGSSGTQEELSGKADGTENSGGDAQGGPTRKGHEVAEGAEIPENQSSDAALLKSDPS